MGRRCPLDDGGGGIVFTVQGLPVRVGEWQEGRIDGLCGLEWGVRGSHRIAKISKPVGNVIPCRTNVALF